jgi:hypothetical protein
MSSEQCQAALDGHRTGSPVAGIRLRCGQA